VRQPRRWPRPLAGRYVRPPGRRRAENGQVVGSTDARGEYPRTWPVGPRDVLATVYHVLGIDYRKVFHDNSGRPIAILLHSITFVNPIFSR
jgi:hypothetical protein